MILEAAVSGLPKLIDEGFTLPSPAQKKKRKKKKQRTTCDFVMRFLSRSPMQLL